LGERHQSERHELDLIVNSKSELQTLKDLLVDESHHERIKISRLTLNGFTEDIEFVTELFEVWLQHRTDDSSICINGHTLKAFLEKIDFDFEYIDRFGLMSYY